MTKRIFSLSYIDYTLINKILKLQKYFFQKNYKLKKWKVPILQLTLFLLVCEDNTRSQLAYHAIYHKKGIVF